MRFAALRLPVLLSAVAVAVCLALVAPLPARAVTVPVAPAFTSPVDPWAKYTAETGCSPTEKPGPQRLRALLAKTYGSTSFNIVRPCSSAVSGHEEGRALDWMISATNSSQKAVADGFLAWLTGPDAKGNPSAMARRMGLMYVIWNKRQWSSYPRTSKCDGRSYPAGAWSPYCGYSEHTDHVHFSFSWDGAYVRTSYFTGFPYLACEGTLTCPVRRLGGSDRYATSAAVAKATVPTSTTVVVTSGENDHLADGLLAAPLAKKLHAPVLLSTRTALPASIAAEVKRRAATTAYLIGGTDVLSDGVVAGLQAAGVTHVQRFTGPDLPSTAAAVAKAMGPASSAVVVSAEPSHLVDALTSVGPAAATGRPVLFVGSTSVPAATQNAIKAQGITSTVVIGGVGAVPDAVLQQLPHPVRLGGTDRYATSAAVATWFASAVGATNVLVASGADANLVDGISGGSAARLTLLTTPTTLAQATGTWLSRSTGTKSALVAGGTGAVATLTAGQVAGILHGR